MKNLLVGFLIIVTFFSCKPEKENGSNHLDLIPSNSIYIIDSPNIEKFLLQTDTLEIFNSYSSFFTTDIKEQIQALTRYSNPEAVIIAINKDEKENLNYVFIAKENPGDISIDSVMNKSIETLTYENFVIQKYILEEITIYKGEKNGVFIASNSLQQLEQILDKEFLGISTDAHFIKAHSAIDRDKTSLLLNSTALGDLVTQSFINVFLPEISLASWNVLEAGIANNAISLNGISTWKENEISFLKIFKNAGTQINGMAKITPAQARGFYSFTYQNIDGLHANLNLYKKEEGTIPADHFLHYTAEAGVISLKNEDKIMVLRATDPELAKELLIPMQESNSFRSITIYKTPDDLDIFKYLAPLLPSREPSYYIWLEDFIVFAENTGDLEQVISSYLNNMTLGKQENYTTAMENLAAASSLLIVSNNTGNTSSSEGKNSQDKEGKKNYPVITMQFVVEDDYAHIHGAFSLNGNKSSNNTGQTAAIKLDAPLATLTYPVKNHVNGQAEIMVQDEKNVLYLYSSAGSLIWKKQFTHQITGEIRQVDISKNQSLQYAFTTPYALHVIDRKGNPVKPFPIEFKGEITQPLSIFDYDNNRNYRFIITQGNNLLMFDAKGKAVTGFDFKKVSSDIIQPPKHIRLNNKDYILVPESSGKLNILSRQGPPRIEVKNDIDFSASPWFPYKGNFITVSSEGKLVKVSENGSVSRETIGENGNIKIAANEKVLAIMADNTLKINDRTVNLDYGLYTSPVIFNSGNKTYISLTDTQAQRVYIFDEKANLLPGFPLYGNSEIRILNNGNGSNIFSVQGGENEVILYKF